MRRQTQLVLLREWSRREPRSARPAGGRLGIPGHGAHHGSVDTRRVPYYYPEPYSKVLVTIDGQQWRAVLRCRKWDAETDAWRWEVDVQIDGRTVIRKLGQEHIEPLPRPNE
jgi:hypothetical protein